MEEAAGVVEAGAAEMVDSPVEVETAAAAVRVAVGDFHRDSA